jgi:hypothetical protein
MDKNLYITLNLFNLLTYLQIYTIQILMKKYGVFLLFLSTNLFAQNYIDFDSYWHSKRVVLTKNHPLKKVLISKGFDLKKKNWIKITLLMNGLRSKNLKEAQKPLAIYLPPRITFEEYLRKHKRYKRSIASAKPYCENINKTYIKNFFGAENIEYLKYFRLISSRKVHVKENQSLYSVIKNDNFSYKSIKEGVHLLKIANGIRSEKFKKSRVINLPFCITKQNKRVVASVKKTSVNIKKIKREKYSPLRFKIGINSGLLNLKQQGKILDSNYAKVSLGSSYNFKNNYILSASFSMTKFLETKISGSGIQPSDSLYSEFGLSLSKSLGNWSIAFAYDSLNFFILDDSVVSANQINRFSVKPYYSISEKIGIFTGLGYINDFSEKEITGFDLSLGASYKTSNNFNLSVYGYQGDISTSFADQNTSSAYGISLSYSF